MGVCERVFVLSVCFCMCCFLLATVSRLWAGEAQCSWQAPTTNADGIPLTDLQNYKIHYGTVSRGSKTAPVTFQYQSSVIISAQ
jgi:hypothetical protein